MKRKTASKPRAKPWLKPEEREAVLRGDVTGLPRWYPVCSTHVVPMIPNHWNEAMQPDYYVCPRCQPELPFDQYMKTAGLIKEVTQ